MEIYRFPGTRDAPLSEVGGKGWSLIRTSVAGLPVPPGYVLPVSFFSQWIARIKESAQWRSFLANNAQGDLSQICSQLKELAHGFQYSEEQKLALARIVGTGDAPLWAVRSSSPEEDLEGSSFAGGYETILGVDADRLEQSIRRAFASCLDARIVIYKRQNGFDITDPKIAVVVQQQLSSEISGVGFSINPINNSYDEAVINSNWGLGETVVSGLVTPDTFMVNKWTKKVITRQLGAKQTSLWLRTGGSTEERPDPRHNELTLADRALRNLTELICQVEKYYQKPIDIEWAFAGGALYLLQARPITGYVPLPVEMVTPPGTRKRLYLDATTSVQALLKPLSVMATSVLETAFKIAGKNVGTSFTGSVQKSMAFAAGGRIYANLSNAMGLVGKERLASLLTNVDTLAASAVSGASEKEYKNAGFNPIVLYLLRNLLASAPRILIAENFPEAAHTRAQKKIHEYETIALALFEKQLPLPVYIRQALAAALKFVTAEMMPLVAQSRIAMTRMKSIAADSGLDESELQKLEQGLPHNVTTEMGLALYRISQLMPRSLDTATFISDLRDGVLPPELEQAWNAFIVRYGHRGPGELDIASPRYRDQPQILIEQLVALTRSLSLRDNPQSRFESAACGREAAYEKVCAALRAKKQGGRLRRFQHFYRIVVAIAGYRETPKFYLIFTIDLIRRRLLAFAAELVAAGRLDSDRQVFDLTVDNVARAQRDAALDLRALAKKNRVFIDKLAKVPVLPQVIDSRGLILRPPPRAVRPGEVAGTPISPGIARGPIKVLHSANEKPLEHGDILVARATDPGWTPLFVNAAAVILEIGGMLQHGALVAREYGLPCVSGIADATSLWEDGTMVEVDGSAGIVRRV